MPIDWVRSNGCRTIRVSGDGIGAVRGQKGRRIVLREEGLRGDDARTTSRAIRRWRELEGKGAREPVAVREFRIAKRQPPPMPTDR